MLCVNSCVFVLLLNSNLSFIKIINAGEQFLVNSIDGMAILLDLRICFSRAVFTSWNGHIGPFCAEKRCLVL